MLVVAAVLRGQSFRWNGQIQGDVNLFALTAREFVQHGRLDYPMKYEFGDRVDYCADRSPASQHPPLFPLAAGVLGRLARSDATFGLLKLLSELGGAILVLAVVLRVRTDPTVGSLVALSLVAMSPTLVDFSGNGSPYVWSALALLVAGWMLSELEELSPRGFFGLGLLAGAAPMIHFSLFAVPIAVFARLGIARPRPSRRAGASLACGAALFFVPWMAWSLERFGVPLHSTASAHVWIALGVAEEGIWGDAVTWRFSDRPWTGAVGRLVLGIGSNAVEIAEGLLRDGGPGALLLAGVGMLATGRLRGRAAIGWALPVLAYLSFVSPLEFRDRFVVPLLPILYVAAGRGVVQAVGRPTRFGAAACVAGALAWMVAGFFEEPRTRYFADNALDAGRHEWYEAMLPVARDLAVRPPGTVLAYGLVLDGGIEAVYHHRQHTVRGRMRGDPREPRPGDVLRKLARDFGARYVWCDRHTRPAIEEIFPAARLVSGNGSFFVFERPPEADARCAPPDAERARPGASASAPSPRAR